MGVINKNLVEKLEKLYQKRLDYMNAEAPVIREILAYQLNNNSNNHPEGEFNENHVSSVTYHLNLKNYYYESEDHVIARMAAYINELASHAAKIHVKDNFLHAENYICPIELKKLAQKNVALSWLESPGEQRIQKEVEKIISAKKPEPTLAPDKKNQITRLSLNEFALYPVKDRGPLSMEGFNKLVQHADQLASKYPENLHLVLASIPVLAAEKEVKNFVIYLQCGSNPIVTTFAKTYPSDIDPVYPETTNPDFIDTSNSGFPAGSSYVYKKNIGIFPSMTISHGGNIICKTRGDVAFRTAIDICLDHYFAVSKTLIEDDIDLTLSNGQTFIPVYTSHILVSNTTSPIEDNIISKSVIQSDPENFQILRKNTARLNDMTKEVCHETQDIHEPPFGSHTQLKVYDPIKLDEHDDRLKIKIDHYNQFMVRFSALKKYREQRPADAEEVHVEIEKHIISYLCNELIACSLSKNISHDFHSAMIKQVNVLKKLAYIKNHENQIFIQIKKINGDINRYIKDEKISTDLYSFISSTVTLLLNEIKEHKPSPSTLVSHSLFTPLPNQKPLKINAEDFPSLPTSHFHTPTIAKKICP